MAVRQKNERDANIKQVKKGAEVRADAAFKEMLEKYGNGYQNIQPGNSNPAPSEPIGRGPTEQNANKWNRGPDNFSNYRPYKPIIDPTERQFDKYDSYDHGQKNEASRNNEKCEAEPYSDNRQNASSNQNKKFEGLVEDLKNEFNRYGKPIAQPIGKSIGLQAKQLIRQVENGAMGGGMPKSHEYKMIRPLKRLATDVMICTAIQEKNNSIIRNLDSNTTSSLKSLKKDLYDAGITTNSNLKLRNVNDFKKISNQMDVLSIKSGLGKISTKSEDELNVIISSIVKKIDNGVQLTSADQMILKAASIQKGFKDTKSPLRKLKKGNGRRIRSSFSRAAFSGINDSYTYRGYIETTQGVNATKAMCKAVLYEGRLVWKSAKFSVKNSLKGTQFILRKVGLQKAANAVSKTTDFAGNVAHGLEHGYNAVTSTPGRIANAATEKITNAGRVATNSIKNAPGKIRHKVGSKLKPTRLGKKIVKTTKTVSKVGSRVINQKVGIKVGRHFIGTNLKGVGKAVTMPYRLPFKGFKLLSKAVQKLMMLMKALMGALLKILGLILVTIFGIVNLLAGFMAVILVLTTIGDAVSSSLEKFKTETTMGATYDKLLEKEREFNAAVADLINEPIPSGYSDYGITQWTNYNVHYIGADGKEMYGSYNYDSGVDISGAGNFVIVVNSTSDRIWEFLKKAGWNDYAIAGIMGNIMNECSMDHRQNSSVDAGIVQWTGSRRTAFMNWTNARGGWENLDLQLRYLFAEKEYKDEINTMGNTNWSSINAATDYFIDHYEMYKNYDTDTKERKERRDAAKSYYDYYTTSEYADIEPDPVLIAELNSGSGDEAPDTEDVDSGISSYGSSTIKGILSMAAIYIDQDFKKYGSYTDKLSIFNDSIYKDYCAKLYDATHIIGKDTTPPTIYYCPAYSPEVSEPEYHVAGEACNNKINGGSSNADWLSAGTGVNRKFSLSITKEEDSYEYDCSDENCNGHEVDYDKYTVLETGPHGQVVYTYDGDASVSQNARKEFLATGCTNYSWLTLERWHKGGTYTYVCHCNECKGHIDGNAYVFISNIYDPTNDATTTSDTGNDETEDGTNPDVDNSDDDENTETSTTKKTDAYDNIEKEDAETRFSMYALDKYATAFDSPTGILGTAICPNVSCSTNSYNDYTVPSTTVVLDEDDNTVCSTCGTEITNYTETKKGREGDQESVDLANTTENRAAEKAIMEELTGKPMEIKNWWKNENWYTNTFTTVKTYFRLFSGEESFDKLEKPDVDQEDRNVVNAGNSTPYWFNAFSSSSGRNSDFEKHGWDNDSISRVRLLMAGDWLELYGIQDFGGVTGAPLTDAQLAQLISNTPEWKNLCSDRKAIIYAAQSFQENVAKRFNTKYVYGGGHGPLKTINQITASDTFDCSSYVSTILYNAGMYYGGCLSTGGFVSSPQFQVISYSELKPGDILVKGGKHIVLYMGGGNISHASTSSKPLKDTYNVPNLQYYINQGFTAMRSINIRENIYDMDSNDNNEEYDSNLNKDDNTESE